MLSHLTVFELIEAAFYDDGDFRFDVHKQIEALHAWNSVEIPIKWRCNADVPRTATTLEISIYPFQRRNVVFLSLKANDDDCL